MFQNLLKGVIGFIVAALAVTVLLIWGTVRLAYHEATSFQLLFFIFGVCLVASIVLAALDPTPARRHGYTFHITIFIASILITFPLANKVLFATLIGILTICAGAMCGIYAYRGKANKRRFMDRLTEHMHPRWNTQR